VNVSLAGEAIITKPLVALESIERGSIMQRLYDEALLLLDL
jgi:D-alanyl-D-alanine carboxypeptidase (penicillin-binding protein 5/6)